MTNEKVSDELETALQLLEAAFKVAPAFVEWLRDLIDGQTDPLSIRVQSILPVESLSRKAQHDIELG